MLFFRRSRCFHLNKFNMTSIQQDRYDYLKKVQEQINVNMTRSQTFDKLSFNFISFKIKISLIQLYIRT